MPPDRPETLLRFGLFEVDLRSGELRKQGRRVRVQEQPLRVLTALLQRPGDLVTREELRSQLWPSDTFVDFDNGLNASVNKLREALGDFADSPRWIETVPRRGYRFIAAVESVGGSGHPSIPSGSLPRTLLKLTVGVAGAIAIVFLTLHLVTRTREPKVSFEKMRLRQLSHTGNVREVAISPDGRYVAYVVESAGRQSIWMRQVATTSAVQIVAPGYEPSYKDLVFSPDGNYVLYRHVLRPEGTGQLETVPVLGGTPRKLAFNVDDAATFSPDGKQLAFVRHDPPSAESWLVVANSDGTGERILARHKLADLFWSPAWSPDGRVIAFASGGFMPQSLVTLSFVSVQEGKEELLTVQKWSALSGLAWIADGRGLVMTGQMQGRSNDAGQVWYLPFPDGKPHQITNDLSNYVGVSVTRDSQNLVTVRKERTSAIWLALKGNASGARQITFAEGRADGLFGLCWTPSGKIVYSSRMEGTSELWLMEADGSKQQQLTASGAFDADPVAVPDGRSIIFTSSRSGGNHLLWEIDADGSNLWQLTHGRDEFQPNVSPDGHWLVYTSTDSGKTTIWKSALADRKPIQLEKQLSWFPAVSPDGTKVAYVLFDEEKNRLKISVAPMEGGPPLRVIDAPATMGSLGLLRWRPDGRALALVETRNGVDNIWSHPLAGGSPVQLTNFSMSQIFAFDWSRDGKQLALARGSLSSDVVLLTDFR